MLPVNECRGGWATRTDTLTSCVFTVVVSGFQELRDDSFAQGQRQLGAVRGAVQRSVAVDPVHGAQQNDAAAASRSHGQVRQCRQGTSTSAGDLRSFNPLIATLQPQSNGPSYSNTVIGTLAVDGWAVTFGTARRGLGGLGPRPVPSSLYQM